MTALCGGGTSSPKAGVAETIIFTTASIASLLNNKGGAWASVVAPLLGVLAYSAQDLCESDPPSPPTFTGAEWATLLQLSDPGAIAGTLAKVADLVRIAVWYELCECDSVNTPPLPAATFANPPSGTNVVGPGVGCFAREGNSETNGTVVFYPWLPWWPGSEPSAFDQRAFLLPPDVTAIVVTARNYDPNATGLYPMNINARWYDSTQALAGSSSVSSSLAANTSTTVTLVPPIANPYGFRIDFSTSIGSAGQILTGGFVAYCGGQVPGQLDPCNCPPDATIVSLLQQIWQLTSLIQRQHVPFAYVPGLEYPGLTGNGEITFSDPIVRAKVELTTLPGFYGLAEGHPDAIFDVGYVALGTADGFERSRPIAHSPMLLQVAGDVTKIGYSLSPGVVAKISTYSREP